MKSLEDMMKELPPELKREVEDFAQFLIERYTRRPQGPFKLDWRGALRDLRDQYTSVRLQHKSHEWWGD